MLVFPQLTSGGNFQYPLRRAGEVRTVVNDLEDGTRVKFQDIGDSRVHWILPLASLTNSEWAAVEQLYVTSEGALATFTLLDPASNLLSWSEDLSQTVWVKDPLIQLGSGVADPFGGAGAWTLTNSGQAAQQVSQTLAAPAAFEYAFSVYVKGAGTIDLVRAGHAQTFSLGDHWTRVVTAGTSAAADSLQIAMKLDPGASAQVFGPQLEAQPAAGPYRRSLAQSGVYSKVRFDTQSLDVTAVGLDRNSSVLRIVSVG
jgi:hypothetical protein